MKEFKYTIKDELGISCMSGRTSGKGSSSFSLQGYH